MIIFVISCNLLITLINLYTLWHLWKLRQVLATTTKTLNFVERRIHAIFYTAPEIVLKGQVGTHYCRQHYQQLVLQLQKVEQLLTLGSLSIRIWQRQSRRKPRLRLKKIPRYL